MGKAPPDSLVNGTVLGHISCHMLYGRPEQSRKTPQTNSLEAHLMKQQETKLKHEVGDLTDEVGLFERGIYTMRAGMPPCEDCGGQGRPKACPSPV